MVCTSSTLYGYSLVRPLSDLESTCILAVPFSNNSMPFSNFACSVTAKTFAQYITT